MPAIIDAAQRSFLPEQEKMALKSYAEGRMARAVAESTQVAAGMRSTPAETTDGSETIAATHTLSHQKKKN